MKDTMAKATTKIRILAYLDTDTWTSEDIFNFPVTSGPTRGEGKPGIEPEFPNPRSSPLPLRHRGGLHHTVKDLLCSPRKYAQ